jgi:hypothetical protein
MKVKRQLAIEAYKIGGMALLTSVTAEGVFQKVFHGWTEDKIGVLRTG